MAWTIAGKRIFVEKDTGWQTQPRQGKIDVLDSNQTIIHGAGRPSYTRTLVFIVFSGYEADILPLADNTAKALISDQGAQGDVIITNLRGDRLQDIKRTTPVYRITMEITKSGI